MYASQAKKKMIQNGRNRNEQGKRKAIRVLVRVFFFWKGATSQMKLQSTAKRDPKKSRFESNKESSQRRSLPKKMFRGKEEANNNNKASTRASTKEPLRNLKKISFIILRSQGREGTWSWSWPKPRYKSLRWRGSNSRKPKSEWNLSKRWKGYK